MSVAIKQIYEIEYFAVSDIGKARANHEDNFLLPSGEFLLKDQVDKLNPRIAFEGKLTNKPVDALHFAVADGMGGHNAGEVASSIVVNKLNEFVLKWHPGTVDKAVKEYKKFIFELNSAVHAFGETSSAYSNLGSTLASVIFCHNKAVSVNVGDSRVYLFRNDGLKRLSKDHTEGQMLIDIGIINNENDSLYKARNSLTRHIGMPEDIADELCYVSSLEVKDSDIFMICSDGLSGVVNDEQISEIFSTGRNESITLIGENLLEASFDTTLSGIAGCDNVTIILFRFIFKKNESIKIRRRFFRK